MCVCASWRMGWEEWKIIDRSLHFRKRALRWPSDDATTSSTFKYSSKDYLKIPKHFKWRRSDNTWFPWLPRHVVERLASDWPTNSHHWFDSLTWIRLLSKNVREEWVTSGRLEVAVGGRKHPSNHVIRNEKRHSRDSLVEEQAVRERERAGGPQPES